MTAGVCPFLGTDGGRLLYENGGCLKNNGKAGVHPNARVYPGFRFARLLGWTAKAAKREKGEWKTTVLLRGTLSVARGMTAQAEMGSAIGKVQLVRYSFAVLFLQSSAL